MSREAVFLTSVRCRLAEHLRVRGYFDRTGSLRPAVSTAVSVSERLLADCKSLLAQLAERGPAGDGEIRRFKVVPPGGAAWGAPPSALGTAEETRSDADEYEDEERTEIAQEEAAEHEPGSEDDEGEDVGEPDTAPKRRPLW